MWTQFNIKMSDVYTSEPSDQLDIWDFLDLLLEVLSISQVDPLRSQ